MDIPSIDQIKQEIQTERSTYPELTEGINSTSQTAIYNLMDYIIAKIVHYLYKIWSIFKTEVDTKIKEQRYGRVPWYTEKTLQFRYGHPLNRETLSYDDGLYTLEQIEASKIIKRAAVNDVELANNRIKLFFKVAKEVGGDLARLSDDEIAALREYIHIIRVGGTKYEIFSDDPDQFRCIVDFFYDPLILDQNGARIDGTNNTPVQDAVRQYLINLKFNGEYTNAKLEDILQTIEGCSDKEAYVRSSERNYLTPPIWETIEASVIANSGYMRITDDNLTINFIPKSVS